MILPFIIFAFQWPPRLEIVADQWHDPGDVVSSNDFKPE
jgi:hypothetical protein